MNEIQDIWDVYDVKDFVKETYEVTLSNEEAQEVLAVMVKQYDANVGYNYSTMANAYRFLRDNAWTKRGVENATV